VVSIVVDKEGGSGRVHGLWRKAIYRDHVNLLDCFGRHLRITDLTGKLIMRFQGEEGWNAYDKATLFRLIPHNRLVDRR